MLQGTYVRQSGPQVGCDFVRLIDAKVFARIEKTILCGAEPVHFRGERQ